MLVVVAACGRFHFSPPDDARSDATIDTAPADTIGCADGTREAFIDQVMFPTIAGCAATWMGTSSLRATATGGTCGNELGMCAVPADACASGWHVCATSGDPTDLTARISAADCAGAGGSPGTFVAASSHCTSCMSPCTNESFCTYTLPLGCLALEPMCCGTTCATVNTCKSGFFAGTTHIAGNSSCSAAASSTQTGVLCCAN